MKTRHWIIKRKRKERAGVRNAHISRLIEELKKSERDRTMSAVATRDVHRNAKEQLRTVDLMEERRLIRNEVSTDPHDFQRKLHVEQENSHEKIRNMKYIRTVRRRRFLWTFSTMLRAVAVEASQRTGAILKNRANYKTKNNYTRRVTEFVQKRHSTKSLSTACVDQRQIRLIDSNEHFRLKSTKAKPSVFDRIFNSTTDDFG